MTSLRGPGERNFIAVSHKPTRGPGNFSAQKAKFIVKTSCIVVWFLADKPLNFDSFTVSFIVSLSNLLKRCTWIILGDPGADSGDEGKSKRAEKCGAKKRKERREEPPGTMSYQTSSKRSPTFWLLIGARKTQVFWHQSEARTAATVWKWSGKTLSPGALLAVIYFSSFQIYFAARLDFPSPLYLPLGLRGCAWI